MIRERAGPSGRPFFIGCGEEYRQQGPASIIPPYCTEKHTAYTAPGSIFLQFSIGASGRGGLDYAKIFTRARKRVSFSIMLKK